MAQTTMPEYLEKDMSSPSTATGQSEPPVPVDQSAMDSESQIDSNGSAHQLPVRQSIKSKRVIRAEKRPNVNEPNFHADVNPMLNLTLRPPN